PVAVSVGSPQPHEAHAAARRAVAARATTATSANAQVRATLTTQCYGRGGPLSMRSFFAPTVGAVGPDFTGSSESSGRTKRLQTDATGPFCKSFVLPELFDLPVNYFEGGCLRNFSCKDLRCIPRRRAASETLPPASPRTRWMCSHSARASDGAGNSCAGGAASPSSRVSAARISSASAGLGRYCVAPSFTASTAV